MLFSNHLKINTSSVHEAYVGGSEITRETFLNEGVLEESIDFSLNSISDGTLKQKSSKASGEDLEIDLDRDLQGHLKVHSENSNRNHYSWIQKKRKILRPETLLCIK